MHLDLTLLTAITVIVHFGATLAVSLLKDNTDRLKIAKIEARVDQVVGTLETVAQAVQSLSPTALRPPVAPPSEPGKS